MVVVVMMAAVVMVTVVVKVQRLKESVTQVGEAEGFLWPM